jgi:hypothetical protein
MGTRSFCFSGGINQRLWSCEHPAVLGGGKGGDQSTWGPSFRGLDLTHIGLIKHQKGRAPHIPGETQAQAPSFQVNLQAGEHGQPPSALQGTNPSL